MSQQRVDAKISLRRGWILQVVFLVTTLVLATGVEIGDVRFGAGLFSPPIIAAVDLLLWKAYHLEIDGDHVIVKKLFRAQYMERSGAYFRDRVDGLWLRERGEMRKLSAHLCWDFPPWSERRIRREIEAVGLKPTAGE